MPALLRRRVLPTFSLLILVAFASLTLTLPAKSQQPRRVSLEPPAGRWQMLPEFVRAVYRGPDGRLWHQLSGDRLGRSDAQLRTLLEAEYRQEIPQIVGVSLALLEPNGRAWFYDQEAAVLWGYDGKSWIERKASLGTRFLGRCPTAGELDDNLANRSAGGKAYFRDLRGVHVFDGQTWSFRALAAPVPSQNGQVRYAVSPSGKYAVALPPKIVRQPNIGFQNIDLWQLHDGEWQQSASPWAEKPGSIGSFFVTDSGVLWYIWYRGSYQEGGRLRWLSLAPPTKATLNDRVAELIAQLDHDAFDVRQSAMEKLAGSEENISAQLETAKKSPAASAEVRSRIDFLLRLQKSRLASDDATIDAIGTIIGQCRIQRPKSVFQDATGRRYVFAEAISLNQADPLTGLAVVEPDGKSSVYSLENLNAGVLSLPINVHGPVLDSQSNSLWISTATFPGPVRRLDLVSGKADAGDPDRHFGVVQAVTDKGHAYIGSEPFYLATSRTSVGLLRPEVADTRPSLTPRMEPLGWGEFIIGDDGVLWAMRKQDGLCRFDGLAWKPVHKAGEHVAPRLAGTGGVLIALTARRLGLFHPGGVEMADTLKELIKNNQPLIAKAFPPSYTPLQRQLRFCISTDASGNIWVTENGHFSVLVNGDWIDVETVLSTGELKQGAVRYLTAVGDGSRVFLSDIGLAHLRGGTRLARIANGKLELAPAPHAASNWCLRGDDGILWVPCEEAQAMRTYTQILGYKSARISQDGDLNDGPNEGHPALIDKSGNMWLLAMKHGGVTDGLLVWRDGRIVQTLKMPGNIRAESLFSDRPGSVYVWTTQGLHHLVAANDDPGTFTLKCSHVLRLHAPGHESAFSPLTGFIVGLRIGTQANLAFFDLPKE